ncbi:hypothetical protein [Helicobacter fennelliae]|mgnify:CR=1 FL=1|uniref:Uncharacterized protein n=2 Tax=Helicobacter fennelliae TaxID=215 RepID=T1CQX8_9HELI|nr:hypothetical protein [Helicobacter fennelliae]GAD19154.1 hypothetical protein HFN_0285 [Helicobacter fennelliae MRY12-0050]SQB98948.1 Uncharacterised protein [Helicobacter fennelliae]STP08229.1 Uncharacterised protein [Helicobacter fennelliae]STQ84640.1 Uncharacterised protein [Helicobacter fennelliae]
MFDLIFYLALFLVVIIACVVIVAKFSKPPKPQIKTQDNTIISFETLMVPLDSPDSTYQDLQKAVGDLFRFYDMLHLNIAQKQHFLFALSRHKNVKSDLVLSTLNQLQELNPSLKKQLEGSVKRGLDRR